MASVSEIAPLETEFNLPSKTRGPDSGPRAPGGFKKAVEEIANVIFSKTRISLEGAAKAVIPSIPGMLSEIAEDIRTGSVEKFKISLEKLEQITSKLGLDLAKYNKGLANFLKEREENTIQSERKIIEMREKGAKVEVNEITGKINVLSRKEIKQRTDTLKQVLRDTKKLKREKSKEEKLLQKSAFLSEAEIQVKKEFVSKSYEQLQEMEQRKETLKSTLGIESDEDLPGTGLFGFGGGGGSKRDSGGEGIREYVPDFIMNIADEFTSQLQMFAEPFLIMKNVIMDVLKPLKILGKLFGPLITGFKKLIAQIGRQILVGLALVAVNLLRLLTDKKVLIGMAALGAILGLKKLYDKFKDGPDGPKAGTAGDIAGEAAHDSEGMNEQLDLKPGQSTSLFRKTGPMFNKDGTESDLSKSMRNIETRKDSNTTINNDALSKTSSGTGEVNVATTNAMNQTSNANHSSVVNANHRYSRFSETIE